MVLSLNSHPLKVKKDLFEFPQKESLFKRFVTQRALHRSFFDFSLENLCHELQKKNK